MTAARATLIVAGQVVLAAEPGGLETAEAVGIAAGRVVSTGSRRDVTDAAAVGARFVDVGDAAVIPGLHDFHLHLVGLARTRGSVLLDDAADGAAVADRLRRASQELSRGAWVTGRGWTESQLASIPMAVLEEAVGDRLAFLSSHDGHSAWASNAARSLAGISSTTPDPEGGRLERDAHGQPTGVLRETALDLVAPLVVRAQGGALRPLLDATVHELSSLGLTGASEAGDYTDENGIGADAAFGDSYSSLTDLADVLDGRLRMTLGIPVDAIPAAAVRGLRTGAPLVGRRTLRFGWAKAYSDGALGSGTAALIEPRTCGDGGSGILRLQPDRLDGLFGAGRPAGIGLAVHAIGDRAVRTVLDAVDRAPARAAGVAADRIEHVQLVRREDVGRFAGLGITASVQPIHAAADRDLVDACWRGREDDAYAWRLLRTAGAHLAAGSDAPVEDVSPWRGMFAAVHRRFPDDGRGDWRPEQSLTFAEALSAYTLGPARAIGAADQGHLRVGARADLAVLTCDLETLRAADERLADVRSALTLLDGEELHTA